MNQLSVFAPEVARFFIEHLSPKLNLTRKSKITQDGKTYYHGSKEIFKRLCARLDRERQRDVMTKWAALVLDFEGVEFGTYLERELIVQMSGTDRDQTPKHVAIESLKEAYFNDSIDTPFSDLRLIINLADKKKSFLYDQPNDKPHMYDFEVVKDRIKAVLGESKDQWIENNSIDCYLGYRPLQARMFKDSVKGCTIFNTWEDAQWKSGYVKNPHAKCPVEVKEFLEAFFEDEPSRFYAQAWLRDATFGRAEPIIVLCGMPGIGKNIFIESLAANLVGMQNYRSASRGFNRSQFHSGITQCRLFFLDEMNLTPEARDNLKAYHNKKSTIERKGVDTGDPEEIFASIAIANNFPDKVKLEYKDRKFYAPILTKVPILKTLGQTKIDRLVRLLDNPTYMSEFANYLYFTFGEGESAKFPKNSFFKKLCINSYDFRFRRFIQLCHTVETFTSRDFNRGQRHGIDTFYLQDLIDHYEVQFDEKLAEVEISVDGKWTAKSFVCKSTDDNVIQMNDHLI